MVVMLGCGRMAAMMRLLKVGGFQETTLEDTTNDKIAAQTIHNEFLNADEANLLEEEDMHVFDCRPLTDPLHLVCCNACKKPIKASQYSSHAECCGPLNSMNNVLELGGSNHKHPTRKGRKLVQSTNGNLQMTAVEQEKSVLMDGNRVGGSTSNSALDNHSSSTAVAASKIAPGGGDFQMKTLRREVPSDASQSAARFLEHGLINNQHHQIEAPAPLASKIYYSRGDHRLRLELNHLFREACAREHGRGSSSPERAQENGTMSSQFLSCSKLPYGTVRDDVPQIKKDACNLAAVQSHDQILAQGSDLSFGKSRRLP